MCCPRCQSTDLRKLSQIYQEGRSYLKARTGLRALLLGTDGPDLLVGNANTVGVLQTQLSKNAQPPTKWSYLKLMGWFVLGSFVALVAYVHSVMSSSRMASSLPVGTFVVVVSCLFVLAMYSFWRHNHLEYPRRYDEWERSFLCQRCGGVSVQPIEAVTR
jgi:hypothetical protein